MLIIPPGRPAAQIAADTARQHNEASSRLPMGPGDSVRVLQTPTAAAANSSADRPFPAASSRTRPWLLGPASGTSHRCSPSNGPHGRRASVRITAAQASQTPTSAMEIRWRWGRQAPKHRARDRSSMPAGRRPVRIAADADRPGRSATRTGRAPSKNAAARKARPRIRKKSSSTWSLAFQTTRKVAAPVRAQARSARIVKSGRVKQPTTARAATTEPSSQRSLVKVAVGNGVGGLGGVGMGVTGGLVCGPAAAGPDTSDTHGGSQCRGTTRKSNARRLRCEKGDEAS